MQNDFGQAAKPSEPKQDWSSQFSESRFFALVGMILECNWFIFHKSITIKRSCAKQTLQIVQSVCECVKISRFTTILWQASGLMYQSIPHQDTQYSNALWTNPSSCSNVAQYTVVHCNALWTIPSSF